MWTVTELALIGVCFVVSLFSVSIGTSAGLTFAAMISVLPPSVVIPVHAVLEGFSSGVRWTLLRRLVDYRFLRLFLCGSLLGFVAGWPLIGLFPDDTLGTMLGAFLLVTVWAPLTWLRLSSAVGGALTSALTVLVGATGPLVAAMIARGQPDHRVVVATQGACTTFQHFGKALLFLAWGFPFVEHAALTAALVLATVVGTALGKRVLFRVPQRLLKLALKLVVSVLGVRLVAVGLGSWSTEVPLVSWIGLALMLALLLVGYLVGSRREAARRDGANTAGMGRSRHFRRGKPRFGRRVATAATREGDERHGPGRTPARPFAAIRRRAESAS